MKIHRSRYHGEEDVIVYSAWEAEQDHEERVFLTDDWYGRIGTKPVPKYSRIDEDEWYEDEYQRAYWEIYLQYPHTYAGRQERGYVFVTTNCAA